MIEILATSVIVLVVVVMFLTSPLEIVPEHERGVTVRLGRCVAAKRPGISFVVPPSDGNGY